MKAELTYGLVSDAKHSLIPICGVYRILLVCTSIDRLISFSTCMALSPKEGLDTIGMYEGVLGNTPWIEGKLGFDVISGFWLVNGHFS